MRVRRRRTLVTVGLAAALILAGCGDDDDDESSSATTAPTTPTTLSQVELDKQKAQRVIITAADVPGFTQDAPAPEEDTPEFDAAVAACLNNNSLIIRLGEDTDTRGANSPDFSKGTDVTVSSSTTFAENDDEARTAMTDLSAASFPGCFSRAFIAQLRRDTTNSNVTATTTKLPALTVGDQSVGYRTVARFRSGGTSITVNADFTFIRSGRGMSVFQSVSSTPPLAEAERTRLTTLIASRMAAP